MTPRRLLTQLTPTVSVAVGFVVVVAVLCATTLPGADVREASVKSADESAASETTRDYFGAEYPGESAELFAPGVVSRPDRFEARIAFSSNLQECYLTETDATFSQPKLLVAHRTRDGWTEFVAVPFSAKFKVCHEPFLADDDKKLYFTADGDEAIPGNRRDFWMVERTASGWGEPARLAAPLNSDAGEFYFNQSSEGTIVFASNRAGGEGDFDLYYLERNADSVERAVNFGAVLNTPGPEYDPCISRDGRAIVFASARHGGPHLDLYVSFRDDLKGWSAPVPLQGGINTAANEYAPTLSPDGCYLFFVRHDGKQSDLFWLAATELSAGKTR